MDDELTDGAGEDNWDQVQQLLGHLASINRLLGQGKHDQRMPGALQILEKRLDRLAVPSNAHSVRREDAPYVVLLGNGWSGVANALRRLEQRDGAVRAGKQACRHFGLAEPHDGRAKALLAAGLNTLAGLLSAVGRPEDALQAAQDARLRYNEYEGLPAQLLGPQMAMNWNILGNVLSALGRYDEALQATREAVRQYRDLQAVDPDRFKSNLAATLSNLGVMLSANGQANEALQASREAVKLHRELYDRPHSPDLCAAELAKSLDNLGVRLGALGLHQEALRATLEAEGYYSGSLGWGRPARRCVAENHRRVALGGRGPGGISRSGSSGSGCDAFCGQENVCRGALPPGQRAGAAGDPAADERDGWVHGGVRHRVVATEPELQAR